MNDITSIEAESVIPEDIFNDKNIKTYTLLAEDNSIIAQFHRDPDTGEWVDVTANPVHVYKKPTVAEIKKQEEQKSIEKELEKAEALLAKMMKEETNYEE